MILDGKKDPAGSITQAANSRTQALIELQELIVDTLRQADTLEIPLVGIHLNQALEEISTTLNS